MRNIREDENFKMRKFCGMINCKNEGVLYMKRYLYIFILTFVGVFLSYSLAESIDNDFNDKLKEILRKLPTSARIVVPDIKFQFVDFETPLSDPEAEKIRLFLIEAYTAQWKYLIPEWETNIENLGFQIVERDAFKDAEKEIVYSQTGEVDPNSSAKFGKAVGATHMVLFKWVFDGFKTGHVGASLSARVIDIEKMLRVGSAFYATSWSIAALKQPETLLNETFYLKPGTFKSYGWNFNSAGTLNTNLKANSDVILYVVDKANLEAFNAGREFRIFAEKNRITSTNFSVSLQKGEYFIVVSNRHSILTTAGVSLSASFTPQ